MPRATYGVFLEISNIFLSLGMMLNFGRHYNRHRFPSSTRRPSLPRHRPCRRCPPNFPSNRLCRSHSLCFHLRSCLRFLRPPRMIFEIPLVLLPNRRQRSTHHRPRGRHPRYDAFPRAIEQLLRTRRTPQRTRHPSHHAFVLHVRRFFPSRIASLFSLRIAIARCWWWWAASMVVLVVVVVAPFTPDPSCEADGRGRDGEG